jgi:hypothetical protein
MSSAKSGNHLGGYHKWKLGFFKDENVIRIDARTLSAGQSVQADIIQSTTAQNLSEKKLIAVQLDDAENMYVLQYRGATGFDNTTFKDGGWVAFPAGVFVYLRAGQAWAADGDEVFMLHNSGSDRQPVVLTQGGIYSDAARKLDIEVTQLTSGRATVTVKRK